MSRSIWALGLVLFLAACGGGGGGGGSRLPTVDPNPTQSLTGLQAPSFADSTIRPTVAGVLATVDSVLVSDLSGGHRGEAYYAPTYCNNKTVCVTDLGGGYTLESDVRDIRDLGLDANLNYSGVGEKHGVSLVQAQGRSEFAGFPSDSTSYGAWLEHNAFIVSLEKIRSGTLAVIDLSGLALAYSVSVGNDTGSRPIGSATWRGIMVGGTGDITGNTDVIQGGCDPSIRCWRQRSGCVLHGRVQPGHPRPLHGHAMVGPIRRRKRHLPPVNQFTGNPWPLLWAKPRGGRRDIYPPRSHRGFWGETVAARGCGVKWWGRQRSSLPPPCSSPNQKGDVQWQKLRPKIS